MKLHRACLACALIFVPLGSADVSPELLENVSPEFRTEVEQLYEDAFQAHFDHGIAPSEEITATSRLITMPIVPPDWAFFPDADFLIQCIRVDAEYGVLYGFQGNPFQPFNQGVWTFGQRIELGTRNDYDWSAAILRRQNTYLLAVLGFVHHNN